MKNWSQKRHPYETFSKKSDKGVFVVLKKYICMERFKIQVT